MKTFGKLKCVVSLLGLLLVLTACGGGGTSAGTTAAALSDTAVLGKKIFSDTSLSASGSMSCATCHSPQAAFAPTNNLAVQLGGSSLTTPGFRATPSLRYLNLTPAFFFDKEGTPTGGFNLDGRVNTLFAQAARPFVAPHEMANSDAQDVIQKLSKASYASEFRRLFGDTVFSTPDAAFEGVRYALQRYQLEDSDFAPYSSKYDAFLANQASLSAQELRGLALFNNPAKGNCAACHPSARGSDGSPPLFTDFTYDNLGVPRNTDIPATADASYFDLGLCGPDRTDLADSHPELCGAFKVPTLRNVATRQVFFHNGKFKTLKDALSFYVTRDTNPELWYPIVNGVPDKFNDLPAKYRANVNTTEAPYNRKLGQTPALSDSEIADLAAFLGTLTDGYTP